MQQRERKEEKGQGEREREREREKGRKDEGRRDQEGRRKEKEREPEVKKDVTDWIVVTRNKRQRKMIQIFVRVNGSKATPMEVNLTDDRVEDVMRRIQNDEDAYVTLHGRVLKRGEKLKSCEVTDGCTIQVTSRLRGGGKHKNKRSMTETKRNEDESGKKDQQDGSMSDKCQEMTKDQKDALIQTIERNEGYRRLITTISEAEDWEYKIQRFGKQLQEKSEIGEERAKVMEWGRWAVEARKRRRDEEQGQSMGQEEDKKDKQVHFGEEERLEETQAESTDELKMMSRSEEVRTGRGSACLVQRTDEKCLTNEICRKGKGKGNGGKGDHGRKGGEGNKGAMHVENLVMDEDQENMRATTSEENHEEDVRKLVEMMQKKEDAHEGERGRMAPNMGAGGSHPQAIWVPETRETREMRWADCEDDERKDEEEREQETEKETKQKTGQEKLTSEKPPRLEQKEDKEKEEKEKRAQEAREDEERRAQEAREEERRAQKAREEQRRAQETRDEERRAQEAREEERRAQEAQEEEEMRAEEVQEQRRAQEAPEQRTREEREGKVQAQERHEGKEEMTTQGECVEDKRETNSMQEEHDVSNRHMTWWRNAWWIRMDSGPHMRTARGRRRIWRAARRAAEQARDNDRVGETQSLAKEAEGETGGRKKWERGTTGEKKATHIARRLPRRKRNSPNSSSSNRSDAFAVTPANMSVMMDNEALYDAHRRSPGAKRVNHLLAQITSH